MSRNILVVGASGYIASRLIPELLNAGHHVRCLARSPQKLARRPWIDQVEVIQADVTKPESLPAALDGQDIVYYLVHSMSAGSRYHRIDLLSARNVSKAAAKTRVQKIIYLGGLADREDENLATHLSSRLQTGDALREGGVPVIEFRSGVIIGAGSVSFEMIRALADQFPILIGPTWLRHKTQPVATRDVVDRLVDAIELQNGISLTVDLGGPEIYTYIDIMLTYARFSGMKRQRLLLPLIPTHLMAAFISLLTPVSFHYALPLVQGLKNDSLVQFPLPPEHFPERGYLPYTRALELAWQETTLDSVDHTWLEEKKPEQIGLFSGLAVHFQRLAGAHYRSVSDPAREWGTHYLRGGWSLVTESRESESYYLAEYDHATLGKVWLKTEILAGDPNVIERTVAFRPTGFKAYYHYYLYRIFRNRNSVIKKKAG